MGALIRRLTGRGSVAPVAAVAAPDLTSWTTPGWVPDLTIGTLRWHDENGPTDRIALWQG